MASSDNQILRLVALFKFVKATLLVATGISILHLTPSAMETRLDHWVAALGLDPGSLYLNHALRIVTYLPADKVGEVALVSFFYAALFLTEGTGLWLQKRWGEWFTVIITASLIPVEIFEIVRESSSIKIIVLVLNIAILAYLVHHIRHHQARSRTHSREANSLIPNP